MGIEHLENGLTNLENGLEHRSEKIWVSRILILGGREGGGYLGRGSDCFWKRGPSTIGEGLEQLGNGARRTVDQVGAVGKR